MSTHRPRLTDEVQNSILAYVRAGGFPQVAAEAAGVPREVFEEWLTRGSRADGPPRYRRFLIAIRQAQAQARLGAEMSAREERPLDWLRNGPGRQTPQNVGWTAAARAATPVGNDSEAVLREAVAALVPVLLEALAPFPEARAALATAVGPLLAGPEKSSG